MHLANNLTCSEDEENNPFLYTVNNWTTVFEAYVFVKPQRIYIQYVLFIIQYHINTIVLYNQLTSKTIARFQRHTRVAIFRIIPNMVELILPIRFHHVNASFLVLANISRIFVSMGILVCRLK